MRRLLALAIGLSLALAACGDDGGEADVSATSTAAPLREATLRVLAAASLTEAFTELGKAFEEEHPGVKVTFTFAASSVLAQQALDGAPADVFASADESNLAKVSDGGAADPKARRVFARNRLAILVERGNPEGVTGLADLAKGGLAVVLCAPEVPCGRLAAAALAKAGVTLRPASLEENVKGVVAKVTLGEADAGLVYVTDAKSAAAETDTVALDDADPALETRYPIVPLAAAEEAELAEDFVDFVLGANGQATLASYGFSPPKG